MGDAATEVEDLLAASLADPATEWSLGSFGALAEFRRSAAEPATHLADHRRGLATARGAIAFAVPSGLVPIAYETPLAGGWSHAVALCLPETACVMSRRSVVTEIGPDGSAIHLSDRGGTLFDLGLGCLQADVFLRSVDPDIIALLRSGCGMAPFDPANPIAARLADLGADRVFAVRCGRIEVFAGPGFDAAGPRAFVVPEILRGRRTHAATAPIPRGLVPVAHLHPPHPCRDAARLAIPFHRARYDAFQALYSRWGDPNHVALKHRIMAGDAASTTRLDRHGRSVGKVARMQAEFLAPPDRVQRKTGAPVIPGADKSFAETER